MVVFVFIFSYKNFKIKYQNSLSFKEYVIIKQRNLITILKYKFKEEKDDKNFRNICSLKSISKKTIIISIIVIVIIIIFWNNFNHGLKISFLDVGQGDCTLIETPNNQVILIDGGNNQGYDYGEKVLMPYLLKHGITKIDYMFFSHMDSDHCRRFILCFRKYEG
jgi:competence protein ComEC